MEKQTIGEFLRLMLKAERYEKRIRKKDIKVWWNFDGYKFTRSTLSTLIQFPYFFTLKFNLLSSMNQGNLIRMQMKICFGAP